MSSVVERMTAGGIESREESSSYWRCSHCQKIQNPSSRLFWVVDSVQVGDSWDSIVYRQTHDNPKNCSGWCLRCVSKLTGNSITRLLVKILY